MPRTILAQRHWSDCMTNRCPKGKRMVTHVTIRDQMHQLKANGVDARNISKYKEKVAHDAGVEPAASAFGGLRSIQLS